jgi:hypothetical protein
MSKDTKIKNPKLMKRSIFVTVFSVVLIGVIIAANIFSTTLAQKTPTTIDLTKDEANSLTPQNIEFIKSISNPVEIVVCATEKGYRGSEMTTYAANVYYVQETATPDNYFNQTITLLQTYPKYNKNISVSFVDPQEPEFKHLESNYEVDIAYGDILVRCTRPDETGKETTFESVITFDDIYELYDMSSGTSGMYGYSTYTITASNIETQVSSAIFTVAASGKKKIALLTNHSTKDAEVAFTTALEGYNFEIMDLDGVISAETLKDIDTVLLVAPVSDISEKELEALSTFLDNGGKRGKNFMVFGSNASPATPNLNEFLEEWGIKVEDGMAYDTNSGYRLSDGQSMMLFNKKNDFTKSINSSELSYYCGDNVAIRTAYESNATRTTNVLMSTSAYAVKAPKGVSGYTASSNDVLGEMPIIIATTDTVTDQTSFDPVTSHVVYFAGADFINQAWEQFGDNGNMQFAVAVSNIINGRAAASVYFYPKITGVHTMSKPLTDGQYTAVYFINIFLLPALLLIGGVVVWFRRRNR